MDAPITLFFHTLKNNKKKTFLFKSPQKIRIMQNTVILFAKKCYGNSQVIGKYICNKDYHKQIKFLEKKNTKN